jgi:hypothetical protein
MADAEYMLTTIDNPFDPFTQFDEWLAYDERSGYHTCGMLDRIAKTSNDLSEPDYEQAIADAIDEIVRENVLGAWIKVNRDGIRSMT